jgi:hypothetical protein
MANPTGRGGFTKGQSGNPGGRPRSLASVMHVARRHTLPALKTLVTLMKEAKSESGWVRPKRSSAVAGVARFKRFRSMAVS